jgi:hypothetical protein
MSKCTFAALAGGCPELLLCPWEDAFSTMPSFFARTGTTLQARQVFRISSALPGLFLLLVLDPVMQGVSGH